MKTMHSLLLALLLALWSGVALAGDAPELTVTPRTIDIGTFYNGTTLTITGEIPEGSDAVVRFNGAPSELHMKEKAKVMGLLWMNVHPVAFRNVPGVFIVVTPRDLGALAGGQASKVAGLGLSGLGESLAIEADHTDRALAVASLLKLKKREGLFREISDGVTYAPSTGVTKRFTAVIPVPPRLKSGDYTVELSVIQDGAIIADSRQAVTAQLTQFPLVFSKLAFGHPALYGIMASIFAILAGLLIGMFFQSKEPH